TPMTSARSRGIRIPRLPPTFATRRCRAMLELYVRITVGQALPECQELEGFAATGQVPAPSSSMSPRPSWSEPTACPVEFRSGSSMLRSAVVDGCFLGSSPAGGAVLRCPLVITPARLLDHTADARSSPPVLGPVRAGPLPAGPRGQPAPASRPGLPSAVARP